MAILNTAFYTVTIENTQQNKLAWKEIEYLKLKTME